MLMYLMGVKNNGILSWLTKNPVKSISGTTSTGVMIFTIYLSATAAPRM